MAYSITGHKSRNPRTPSRKLLCFSAHNQCGFSDGTYGSDGPDGILCLKVHNLPFLESSFGYLMAFSTPG